MKRLLIFLCGFFIFFNLNCYRMSGRSIARYMKEVFPKYFTQEYVDDMTIRVLAQFAKRGYLFPLRLALTSKSPNVREEVLRWLVGIGDTSFVDDIIYQLDHEHPGVRFEAARTLVNMKIKDQRAVEPLMKLLDDENEDVRDFAIQALGQIGDSTVVEPLIEIFWNDECPGARWNAVMALGEIGSGRALEELVKGLQNDSVFIRRWSAEALFLAADTSTVEELIAALKDKEVNVRKWAVRTLGIIGDSRAVESIIKTLKDEHWMIRRTSVFALKSLADTRAEEALIEALRDEEPKVRGEAARALVTCSEDDPYEIILDAFQNESEYSAQSVMVLAFGDLKDTAAVPYLIEILEDDRSRIKSSAAWSLGQIGDTSAVEPLIALLHEEIEYACKHNRKYASYPAAAALAEIGDYRVVEIFIDLLRNDDPNLRKKVASCLERMCRPEKELGASYRKWRRWWRKHWEEFR